MNTGFAFFKFEGSSFFDYPNGPARSQSTTAYFVRPVHISLTDAEMKEMGRQMAVELSGENIGFNFASVCFLSVEEFSVLDEHLDPWLGQ